MPFKLKLKKTRQYNVVSKSLFVISIELLDGIIVECTLGSDSTGQDCLENVCQRLVINQPDFFGLRYINRNQHPRWVDLERPLKRQLDKYASSHQLYLRVMYYVISGTKLISDEVTRYHYFLQLKNDVVEGRIVCDCQQAVLLASYSRQAEYGNHDTERHTVDYLKNLLSFPKQMFDGGQIIDASQLLEGGRLERLTAAVIHQHQALHNLPQAQAEEGYISACQVLNGYGQETFIARDQTKQMEIMIAISLTGIMVATENSNTPKAYRWTDITNVINHKRTFSIECQNPSDSATFVFPTPEDGKYIWRMCVLQHTFYMKHQQSITTINGHLHGSGALDVPQPTFQNNGLADSRDDLDNAIPDRRGSLPGLLDTNIIQSIASLEPSVVGTNNMEPPRQITNVQRAHSTSCLDLTSSNSHLLQQRDVDKLRALLPTYRAAPDYETAVQQKYQRAQATHFTNHQSHSHAHVNQVNTPKPIIYGSHPEIHRQVHYPDVTRHTAVNRPSEDIGYGLNIVRQDNYQAFNLDGNMLQSRVSQPIQYLNVYKPPPPYPSNGLVSNSTPDLAVASQALGAKTYHRGFINTHVSGSSPDLVSSRTILNRQYMGYLRGGNMHNVVGYAGVRGVSPSAHGTYENLASVMDVPSGHVLIDPSPHLANHIQKVYDERGNIMYCMPSSQVPYQAHLMLPQAQKIPSMKATQEPIYENVPLPWQNERQRLNTMRERAQSLTTAPEASRLPELKSSQPVDCIHKEEHKAMIHSQPNISYTAAFNPNVQVPNYDSLYANAQVHKANNGNSVTIENATKLSVPKLSSKQDVSALSNSVDALSVSRETHNSRMSLASTPNSNTKSDSFKRLDKKVLHTNLKDSHQQMLPIDQFYNNNSLMSTPATDNRLMTSQISLTSNKTNIDATLSSTSYIDSVQSSSTELDTSSSTNTSVSSKEKKRRRWGMFMGRTNKNVEVKSATLGRDTKSRNVNMVASGPAAKHRWSTGLPKFQPLPPSITKETLCQILERKMSDTQMAFAFQQIPKGRETNAEMTTAMMLENAHINGTVYNYLPYEDNRVKLLPMKSNRHGYINASHITMTVGNSQRFYVIASIPNICSVGSGKLPVNVEDYCALLWALTWEIGAKVIALVTGNIKPVYIPPVNGTAEYGQYSVYTESTQQTEYGTTSHICLARGKMTQGVSSSSSRLRSVWHVHYKQWPLNAEVPHLTEHFLGFLNEVSALRRHCVSEIHPPHNANPPLLLLSPAIPIHPTASTPQFSATPAATALTADLLLHALDHNQELDIPRTISLLHQQRANLIQNIHQYRFLHEILINYLKKSRLI